ncbi:MAG TPA: hypothetical protein VE089_07895 [Nitrososphaeraceae archaeon]|nr:hypothetical protein [Nitrososphaeraceae archaeon]
MNTLIKTLIKQTGENEQLSSSMEQQNQLECRRDKRKSFAGKE